MNLSFLKITKIYLITFIIFLILVVAFSFMIKDKQTTSNYAIPQILIGCFTFFVLGLLSSNYHQKKGILISFLYSFVTLLIIILCLTITDNKFDLMVILKYIIFIISSLIGGILGVNIKKFI